MLMSKKGWIWWVILSQESDLRGLKVYSQSFSGNIFLPKQPQAFGSGWMEYGAKKPPDLFCNSRKKLCGVLDFPEEKIAYSKGIALAIEEGELEIDQLSQKTDQEAKSQLVKLRGFGEWSAEIYLVFSLGRTDIYPANDLALQESLKRFKGLKDRPNENESRKLVSHWSPWRSVGALFLWKYYRGAPDERDE